MAGTWPEHKQHNKLSEGSVLEGISSCKRIVLQPWNLFFKHLSLLLVTLWVWQLLLLLLAQQLVTVTVAPPCQRSF